MTTSPTIEWPDFEKIDIRVGTILEVNEFPKAKRPAWQLTIDFGPLGIKKSSAQITELYARSDLPGRQVLAVVNFPPRQIGPFLSEVLVLGALDEAGKVVLLHPDEDVPPGARIA